MKPLLRRIRLKDERYHFVGIFIVLSLGIIIIAVIYFWHLEQQFRSDAESQLSAIVNLKVNDLARWRYERLTDANVFYQNAVFSGLVRRFFENPGDRKTQKQLRLWLGNFQAASHYERVMLLDPLYSKKMIIPDGPERSTVFISPSDSEDLRSGKVVFQDFYCNEQNQKIYLKVLVPISDEADGGRVIGILALRIDPEVYLYPLITRWPMLSSTAETLLVRRDGNDALFLNNLRFQTNAALKLRIPLDNNDAPAVKALLGTEGIVEGVDYRGVKVIASLLRVPNSPWFMVARMDISEIHAPIKRGGWIVVLVVLLLLLITGIGITLIWQRNAKAQYKSLFETELARREAEDELRASEVRFRELFNHMSSGVAVYEAVDNGGDFIFRDFNPAAEKIEKTSRKDILGKRVSEAFQGVKAFGVFEVFQRVWQTGKQEYFPESIYKDERDPGSWREAWVFKLPTGEIVAVYNDITERKRAEEILQNSESFLNSIINQSPSPLWIADAQGTLIRLNQALKDLLNISEEDVVGKYNVFKDNIVEEQGFIPIVRRVFEKGETARFELKYDSSQLQHLQLRHVAFVILDVNIFPIWDACGNITHAVIQHMDITERKQSEEKLQKLLKQGDRDRQILLGILEDERRAQEDLQKINIELEQRIQERKQVEEALRESEKRFMSVLYASHDAILLIHENTFVDCNDATVRMLGYATRADLLQTHPSELSPPLQPDGRCSMEKADEMMRLAFERGFQQFEWMHRRANGEDFPVEVSLTPIVYQGNDILYCIWRDITTQRQLEAHVRQTQKLEAIGTLAGGVAHEINNPVMGIMNYAELIEDKVPKDSEIAEFTGEIKRETERVATIVRNLLNFARPEKHKHSPARMCDIVEATLSLTRTIMRHDQIALTVAVPETLPKIKCRSQQIQQVLMNLLTNARDALIEKYPGFHDNKQLAIFAGVFEKEGQRWIRTSVEDHGPGIPPHVRDRVFDPFFTTKSRDKGTGLGLSISLGIVKDHGGELIIESTLGEYTRFHMDLPVDNGWDIKGVREAEAEETRERGVRNAEGGPTDER